ncbi:MAG: hypothetical protein AAGF36_04530 [Pseudomonadota bacterium]
MKHPPLPNRLDVEGAATPIFIVHGHRHACLYRASNSDQNPFIVLKICKKLRLMAGEAFAYLRNNEVCRGL